MKTDGQVDGERGKDTGSPVLLSFQYRQPGATTRDPRAQSLLRSPDRSLPPSTSKPVIWVRGSLPVNVSPSQRTLQVKRKPYSIETCSTVYRLPGPGSPIFEV